MYLHIRRPEGGLFICVLCLGILHLSDNFIRKGKSPRGNLEQEAYRNVAILERPEDGL